MKSVSLFPLFAGARSAAVRGFVLGKGGSADAVFSWRGVVREGTVGVTPHQFVCVLVACVAAQTKQKESRVEYRGREHSEAHAVAVARKRSSLRTVVRHCGNQSAQRRIRPPPGGLAINQLTEFRNRAGRRRTWFSSDKRAHHGQARATLAGQAVSGQGQKHGRRSVSSTAAASALAFVVCAAGCCVLEPSKRRSCTEIWTDQKDVHSTHSLRWFLVLSIAIEICDSPSLPHGERKNT